MLKTLINIGMLNDQTNYVMLAVELVLFILIFAVVAFFIYKKTKRRKTLVISAIYLLSGSFTTTSGRNWRLSSLVISEPSS